MTSTVEKDWTTNAGFRAVVLMTGRGHRCGYVAIPRGHVLHGCDYSDESDALTFPADEAVGKRGVIPLLCGGGKARPDVVFDVHGGITFAGGADDYPVANDGTLWWFGYDCGHAGDAPSDEHIAKRWAEYPDKPYMWDDRDGQHRSLAYCIAECESLARQLIDRVKVTP